MRGASNDRTNTSKTQAPLGVSSDTSRLSSCILRGRRLEESLNHQGFEVLRRHVDLRVDFGWEMVVVAQIFQGTFRPRPGGWARREGWWEGTRVKEMRRSRAIGPGSVAPTGATGSHTTNYRERLGFLLHTRRRLLGVMVAIFRSSAKETCDIF